MPTDPTPFWDASSDGQTVPLPGGGEASNFVDPARRRRITQQDLVNALLAQDPMQLRGTPPQDSQARGFWDVPSDTRTEMLPDRQGEHAQPGQLDAAMAQIGSPDPLSPQSAQMQDVAQGGSLGSPSHAQPGQLDAAMSQIGTPSGILAKSSVPTHRAGAATTGPLVQALMAQQQGAPQGAPQDPDSAALVAALRGQQGLGQLFQLSGDRVLAPFGQGLDQSAQRNFDNYQQQRSGGLKLSLEAKKQQQEAADKQRELGQHQQEIDQTKSYQRGELANRNAALGVGRFETKFDAATGRAVTTDQHTGKTTFSAGPGGGVSKFTRLPDADEKTLGAVLNGIDATDTAKKARSGGGLLGRYKYGATLDAELPAIAAAESGSGRAASQAPIGERAPGYVSPAGDTFYDVTRAQLVSAAQAAIDGHKQRGYDVSVQEQRLAKLKGSGGGGATGPMKIAGDDDFEKLPSGAEFIGPDGKRRRKP